jgi:large subunit ribosomal protein L16
MLIPRRVKFRKQHRPSRSGKSKGGTSVAFGDFGLQATEGGYVTNRQIEAARIAMTRYIKRGGKVWINIYPRSLLKLVWVPVRVHQNFGLQTSSQAEFYLRSLA